MVRIVTFGVGNRAGKYLGWVQEHPSEAALAAIVEPDPVRMVAAKARYGLNDGQCFESAEAFFEASVPVDAAIITAPDREHKPIALRCIERGLHILLEKPVATSWEDCLAIAEAAEKAGVYVSVCFILRLHPYWRKMRSLISSPRFGRLLSVHHEVNAGIDRCVHTFVRGLWSREEESSPLILSKCCHDLDLLVYLCGSEPVKTASFGSLGWFRSENAPEGAGKRCLDCPLESSCAFSAVDLYRRRNLWNENFPRLPEESLEDAVERELRTGRYGRCVYACDNDVTDHQSVLMEMSDGTVVSMRLNCLTMDDNRLTTVNASGGEIRGDGERITVRWFDTAETEVFDMSELADKPLHAGMDHEIVRDFIGRVKSGDFDSEIALSKVLSGHRACFEAEKYKNLYLLGRLANYKYINMDIAVLNAMKLFDTIKDEIGAERER